MLVQKYNIFKIPSLYLQYKCFVQRTQNAAMLSRPGAKIRLENDMFLIIAKIL